jgi:hypothetical protein
LQQKSLFYIFHTKYFRRNTFGKVIKQFLGIHALMNIFNTFFHLFADINIDIFFLLPYYFSNVNVSVEEQVFVHGIFWDLSGHNDALDFDDVSWLGVVYVIASQLQMNRFWNRSAQQLFGCLLHF